MDPMTSQPPPEATSSGLPKPDTAIQPLSDISRLGLACQKHFEDLIDNLGRAGPGDADGEINEELSIAVVPIKEELGRFRTWANNIGAITTGRGSLDYRVRGAEYLRHNVKSLLESLEASLLNGIIAKYNTDLIALLVTSGNINETPSISDNDTESSETESSGSFSSESSVESPSQLAIPPGHPLRVLYSVIVDIIDKLFKLSIFIRGSSPKFRFSRAAAYIEKDELGCDILPAFKDFVRFKLRQAQSLPEWLVNRLTDAIAMRRQQFYYQRAHRRHMTNDPINQEHIEPASVVAPPQSIQATSVTTTQNRPSMARDGSPPTIKIAKSMLTTNTYSTIATDFNPEPSKENSKSLAEPTKTEIAGENIFPGPPKGPKAKAFECHQCFRILPGITRRPNLWR
jgi:hypothetical protein